MMDWIWKSNKEDKGNSKPENKDDLGFLDPSLKEYYNKAKPIPPISLAPEEVKEEYKRHEAERLRQQELPNFQSKEEGLHQISERAIVTGLPLGQAARNNCVEYEALMADCAIKGSYWDRLNMCHTFRKQHMKCVDLQTDALKTLGYTSAVNDQQRSDIQVKVDDIFSMQVPEGAISEQTCAKFEEAIEKERQKSELYRA